MHHHTSRWKARDVDSAMAPSVAQALVMVDELIVCGVTDVVMGVGSRSAPLALALASAEDRGDIRLHVRVDERVAGFVALGLGKTTGVPAAVVTTSGSAVANLLPAVVEAAERHSRNVARY